jgi:DNA-binding PadR family transcriptional regulator
VHKLLLLLGLLRSGPMSGYDLHRVVRAHGELSTDLKKANVYYLLDRLAADGYLSVRAEPGARGPRGERLIYSLTSAGCIYFEDLLREVLRTYDPAHIGVDVAFIFLGQLSHAEALALLEERRQVVAERRRQVLGEQEHADKTDLLQRIAFDHLISLIDAELAWVERAVRDLRANGWQAETERKPSTRHAQPALPDPC